MKLSESWHLDESQMGGVGGQEATARVVCQGDNHSRRDRHRFSEAGDDGREDDVVRRIHDVVGGGGGGAAAHHHPALGVAVEQRHVAGAQLQGAGRGRGRVAGSVGGGESRGITGGATAPGSGRG